MEMPGNESDVDEYSSETADDQSLANLTNMTSYYLSEVLKVPVPIIFSLISILGFVGNLCVIIVVIANHQMRNTTNLLIIHLASADLIFIVICVPFTAMEYVIPYWSFGVAWCKVYQYVIHVTAYVSVYTLVLMSLDRFMAVVHPISSMTLRTQRNTLIAIGMFTSAICLSNGPLLFDFKPVEFTDNNATSSYCINVRILEEENYGKIFYGCFFAFAYAIPLGLVSLLYGWMLCRLYGMSRPGQSQARATNSARSKKRITRMVLVVIGIFALCWAPLQFTLVLQYFVLSEFGDAHIAVKIVCTCVAYMNSCVNPFLYAFLSESFRKSFRKLLCCDIEKFPNGKRARAGTSTVDGMTTNNERRKGGGEGIELNGTCQKLRSV